MALHNYWKRTKVSAESASLFQTILEIKSELAGKDGEISELKVRIDELQTANQREIKAKNEMQDHYQRRIREKQGELEQYRVYVSQILTFTHISKFSHQV